jgi:hypothetical protein
MCDADDILRRLSRKWALSVADKWDCPATVRQYLETGDGFYREEAYKLAIEAVGKIDKAFHTVEYYYADAASKAIKSYVSATSELYYVAHRASVSVTAGYPSVYCGITKRAGLDKFNQDLEQYLLNEMDFQLWM